METTPRTRRAAKPVQGSHEFEISGFSRHREVLGAFSSIHSPVFRVGAYDWQIHFYPGGFIEYFKDYVAVYLTLESENITTTRVRASVQFSLVDVTGSSRPHTMVSKFDSRSIRSCGYMEFKHRGDLKGSPYRRGDRLTIKCVITLDKESLIQTPVEVPPSDVTEDHRKLLQAKEDTDVIFEVHGETFPAHKTVLAMRSPVFKAELYGAMREKDMRQIAVADMQPAVFEALLQYMYTGSLPVMDDLGRDDYGETIRHLLVAADRYAVERLKMICESILCNSIDEKTVMTTLVLADQHDCGRLNDACFLFIATLDTTGIADVMASQGYVELEETCPLAIVELWEKINNLYKSKSTFHIGGSVV